MPHPEYSDKLDAVELALIPEFLEDRPGHR
jgi:hypothetical protein